MSRRSLACAVGAGLLAAAAVVHQRIGLALTVTLLTMLAAGALEARRSGRPVSPALLALAVALALQPVLRDAGWVVALTCAGALVAGGAAVLVPATWGALAWALVVPMMVVDGVAAVVRAIAALVPSGRRTASAAVLRGVVLAGVLVAGFGVLFVTADSAFAELAGDAVDVDADPGALVVRAVAGLAMLAGAGALVRAGQGGWTLPARSPQPWAPGRTELRIALTALVALFLVFVAVQLRVLFGGAAYVRETTGLGFGDYARSGFVQLLIVAALTLAVVAIAARRRDPRVRALLGVLCALTLVVLASALHRLGLVIDAYGLTRVRYSGLAVIVVLGAVLVLVLAAGASVRVARLAPRIVLFGGLVAALGFSLSNPDARIATWAVDHDAYDAAYLGTLSADAVPALRRLPAGPRERALRDPLERLRRPDGVAGFNLSRRAAR